MVSMIARHTDSSGAESTDPDIRMAYRSITQRGTLDWSVLVSPPLSLLPTHLYRLALSYGKWSPGLKLSAAGSQGLSELKRHISESEQSVFLAFCRLAIDGDSCFATITYVPDGTSGLRKARTSMASRTVQSWYKGPQATLTISRLEDLSISAILDAMPFPPSSSRPLTEPTQMARTSSASSSFEAPNLEKALPHAPSSSTVPLVTRTISEPPPTSTATFLSQRGPPDFGDPVTRSEQREAARRASEEEEYAARREEVARQLRIKRQRDREARQAEEEERTRRAQLEQDLARKAAARLAREEEERAEEERRVREREERRRRDAEKRAEVARRMEEWRLEEERRKEELARAEGELKRRAVERREAARVAAAKRRRDSQLPGGSVILSGWVTVQTSGSVAWRRRYFQLTDAVLRFYNRDKASRLDCTPVDVIVLKSTGPTVKEWYEGFEELRSIPHSFALVLSNGEPPIMFFSDTAPEKVRKLFLYCICLYEYRSRWDTNYI
ncbi:hypothetical protein BGW80DRAFT_1460335 [Lactifluus volemus]|nr:hypothetical protein BGW80DRAFT_1460335 [Lactifluus volemus]